VIICVSFSNEKIFQDDKAFLCLKPRRFLISEAVMISPLAGLGRVEKHLVGGADDELVLSLATVQRAAKGGSVWLERNLNRA
jgi:hypothetical protein